MKKIQFISFNKILILVLILFSIIYLLKDNNSMIVLKLKYEINNILKIHTPLELTEIEIEKFINNLSYKNNDKIQKNKEYWIIN